MANVCYPTCIPLVTSRNFLRVGQRDISDAHRAGRASSISLVSPEDEALCCSSCGCADVRADSTRPTDGVGSVLILFTVSTAKLTGNIRCAGQCGGIGWTGATTCVSGFTCTKLNGTLLYFQCPLQVLTRRHRLLLAVPVSVGLAVEGYFCADWVYGKTSRTVKCTSMIFCIDSFGLDESTVAFAACAHLNERPPTAFIDGHLERNSV